MAEFYDGSILIVNFLTPELPMDHGRTLGGEAMTRNLGAAIVVAAGLVLAAILTSGLYDSRLSGDGLFLWRTNKFTGAVRVSVVKSAVAGPICYDAKSN